MSRCSNVQLTAGSLSAKGFWESPFVASIDVAAVYHQNGY